MEAILLTIGLLLAPIIKISEEMPMYSPGLGGSGLTATGIALLPNTGGNVLFFIISLLSIVIGSLIVLSTIARFVARKIYRS